jgi:O-acetylhomoserine/O-acetylserine sulfhydrylase-like pyridoxal-dependent enzyme
MTLTTKAKHTKAFEHETPSVESYSAEGLELMQLTSRQRQTVSQRKFDTVAVHGMYSLEEALKNQGSIIEPAYLSPAQHFANSNQMAAAFAYQYPAWAYTRLANPTVSYLEATLALLEGYGTSFETSACMTSSGMAAVAMATQPFLTRASGGQMNIVATAKCYGGVYQLFSERYGKERGANVRWIKDGLNLDEWERAIDKDTRFVFGEMPSNPQLGVFDIEAVAQLAHAKDVPFIVDATVATPALMRPLAHGADIVVHSVSKSMAASGLAIAGVVISKANIPSRVLDDGMKSNFATSMKLLPFRDFGPSISPMSALLILSDLRDLRYRLDAMSQNTLVVAQWLEQHPKIEQVFYPGLPSNKTHATAKRYMKLADTNTPRFSHLLGFTVKGGNEAARKVIDCFRMIFQATDLGKVKSVATLPTTTTHQQQGDEGRQLASIPGNMIRLSVGLENPQDILADIEQALSS